MTYLCWFLLFFLHGSCASLLWASLWPGLVGDILIWPFILGILFIRYILPIMLGVLFIQWLFRRWYFYGYLKKKHPRLFQVELEWKNAPKPSRKIRFGPWMQRGWMSAIALIFATSVLLSKEIPRKFAFHLVRPAFEAELATLPSETDWQSSSGKRFGVYWVSDYRTQKQGGTYFKTGFHGFIWSDSYGFVHQPHPEYSPFGDTPYHYYPLVDDWYWFQSGYDW